MGRSNKKSSTRKRVSTGSKRKSDSATTNLASIRESIDRIDERIHELLNERAKLAQEVGLSKKRAQALSTVEFYKPEREAQVLRQVVARNQGPLRNEEVVRLFREIMSACLAQQEPLKVAFLGPEGTFSQQAVLKHFGVSSVSPLGVATQRVETRAGRAAPQAIGTAAFSIAAGPSSSTPLLAGEEPPRTEAESIGRELTHTDRLIAVLKPKILRSGGAQAQSRFADAVAREKEARDAFAHSLYARATRLTREARSLAREAAVMVGPPENDPLYVARSLDNAEEALALAHD